MSEAISHGFVDTESVFIDSTHIKASANKKKKVEEFVQVEAKNYQTQLDKEIDEDRAEHGKKPFKREPKEELKKVTKSTTDADAGDFHKGEHERCFAYSAHTACDKNGFVLKATVTAGNVHDSRAFSELYQDLIEHHEIENVVVDAGYKIPAIAKEIIDSGKTPVMPYARPKGVKPPEGQLRKKDFFYNSAHDHFVSPTHETFEYSTTDRNGYRIYKRKGSSRVLTRHIWQDYLEIAEIIRLTPHGKETYKLRSETIERVFGDAKEKHALRWTTLRSIAKLKRQVTMTFACMNLKKLATWIAKIKEKPTNPSPISNFFANVFSFFKFA